MNDTIYLNPYQEAIISHTSPVLLCKADRQVGTTTAFANVCRDYTDKEDLIVLFCNRGHYDKYLKILHTRGYTGGRTPKNVVHRSAMNYKDLFSVLESIRGCTFKRCVVVVDEMLISKDFNYFIESLTAFTRVGELKVRVKEDTLLDVRYKGWYDSEGNYVDTFAGLDFNMISCGEIDV